MRSHAKASTAGSTQRQAGRLGRIFPGAGPTRGASSSSKGSGAPTNRRATLWLTAFAASLLAMLQIAAPASAATPTIAATWSQGVLRTEATLKAEINPEGLATTYRFEYGTSTSYGQQTPELAVGSDSSLHEVTRLLSGLQPGTTYHYRVVATNTDGPNQGPDRSFTTFAPFVPETNCPNQAFRYGPSANLPECRAYEMVSPVDKSGADIIAQLTSRQYTTASDQASLDGNKMAYSSYKPFGDALSNLWTNSFIATRGAGGWTTHSINPPHEHNQAVFFLADPAAPRYSAFSEDLSTGFLYDDAKPALTSDALPNYPNFYLRDNLTDTYTALTTQIFSPAQQWLGGMGFQGYSADGSHTLFVAAAQLTPAAAPGEHGQLYDYHDGELELVSVLPGGEPSPQDSSAGQGGKPASANIEQGETSNAISEDGSRIFWIRDGDTNENYGTLYVRIDGETTITVSTTSEATYWAAAADGSQVIFNDGVINSQRSSLYRFDVDTETRTLIADEVDFKRGVLGASEDASSVYFLSREALAAGATAGQPNLYLDEEGTKTFIATLAQDDETGAAPTVGSGASLNADPIFNDFSRVSPDGGRVFFHSLAPLTRYDNTSANADKPAVEIYTYDADAEELECVSCNPSGGRPQTSVFTRPHKTLFETEPFDKGSPATFLEAAAQLPTPRRATHIPRMLADDGSYLFFNAHDALVPEDVNNTQDVYQWVAQGVSGCAEEDGCVRLISTGTNPKKSTFIDASGDGRDVFIRTSADIAPLDEGFIDIYDVRVGGGFPRPIPPPECVGDACQSVPAAPRDQTPASAGFRGAGDP
ncbi:MAG: fibronectin type III domain-containing protein, partial [Solirubrobacterales bacterium]